MTDRAALTSITIAGKGFAQKRAFAHNIENLPKYRKYLLGVERKWYPHPCGIKKGRNVEWSLICSFLREQIF
jgi:hypothetical protein